MIYGSIWAHMGPYGWPEMKKQREKGEHNYLCQRLFTRAMSGGFWPTTYIYIYNNNNTIYNNNNNNNIYIYIDVD